MTDSARMDRIVAWLSCVGLLVSPAGPLATALGVIGAPAVGAWCVSTLGLLLIFGVAGWLASRGCSGIGR